MARFIGWLSAYKGDKNNCISRISANRIQASARGWNVGGDAYVYAIENDQKHSHDTVRLSVDGGSNGALMGHTVAWLVETDGKPSLRIHIPKRSVMEHDFSQVIVVDDETDSEKVIYQES